MNKLSFFDKLKILIDISISSYWFLIMLILLIGLGFTFIKTTKKTRKRNQIIYIGISVILFLIVLITHQSSINHLLDYLIDNVFIAILFPNLAIYFLEILITNIILWISLFRYQTSDRIKKINIIVYIILNYLFVLILSVTKIEKIDIFSQSSLYMNSKATALMELSSFLFVTWILFLVLYKSFLIYIRKDYQPIVKKVIVNKPIKKLPENYLPTDPPKVLFGTPGRRVMVIETNPKQIVENYEKSLTLEDYQILLKILKEKKLKKNKAKEQLIKEQIRILKEQEQLLENEKYTELDTLYRSMR